MEEYIKMDLKKSSNGIMWRYLGTVRTEFPEYLNVPDAWPGNLAC